MFGKRRARAPRLVRLALAAAVLAAAPLRPAAADSPLYHAVEAHWEFDLSLDGWARGSPSDLDAEVYHLGGELRGVVDGPEPVLDSPLLGIEVSDRHYFVARYSYLGPATAARVTARVGVTPAPADVDLGAVRWEAPAAGCWDERDSWSFVEGVSTGRIELVADTAAACQAACFAHDGCAAYTFFAANGTCAGRDALSAASDAVAGAVGGLREQCDAFATFELPVVGDGQYRIAYVPLHEGLSGTLTQLRVQPARARAAETGVWPEASPAPVRGNVFAFDWMRVAKAPGVMRVTGCVDVFFAHVNRADPVTSLTPDVRFTNGFHEHVATEYGDLPDMPYASTYNCERAGGQRVTVAGRNFGAAPWVTVGGQPCADLEVTAAESELRCTLPASASADAELVVGNAAMPGLTHALPDVLRYAEAPPAPARPTLSNIAARAIDVSWAAPADYLEALPITGYRVAYRRPTDDEEWTEFVVGNVTTTTCRPLRADAEYEFKVAALAEPLTGDYWLGLDLYGRRAAVEGALQSEWSLATNRTATLAADVAFQAFDANGTLEHGSADARATTGASGSVGGEGAFGLMLVGDARVEGCNASHSCCDGFDPLRGQASCGWGCSAKEVVRTAYVDGAADHTLLAFSPRAADAAEDALVAVGEQAGMRFNATLPCGPALRLTADRARLSGAAWYARQLNVREGFDTTFTFRLSQPSTHCVSMDDVYTHCRSRGADGLAFVVQNQAAHALGDAGSGLGYGGVANSLAVELDSWYNPEHLDLFDNHISVHTRGFREPNSPAHSYSLAATSAGPDLADGPHTVRVLYEPAFDLDAATSPRLLMTPHTAGFLDNADFPNGGQADWGTGVGLLSVFVDDLHAPLFVTPLNLDATLDLEHGRAWVGFTAATGEYQWQVHDVLDWTFSSLREDPADTVVEVPTVNGVGGHECSGAADCRHY